MSRTLLVLGASLYQVPAIETARELGCRVVVTDNVPENPGHALADRSYHVDTTDRDAVLEVARRERIDGVVAPCTDVAVPTAAWVAYNLRLPGIPPGAAEVLCDKVLFRDFMRLRGISAPEWHVFDAGGLRDGDVFNGARFVMKPDRSSGSKGVFVVESEEQFRQRLAETLSFARNGRGILERFIEGRQGTCEGIIRDGTVAAAWIMDRATAALPYTATWGQHVPSRMAADVRGELLELVGRLCSLLHIADAVFDCDFVVGDDGVRILELTPRVGGNSIAALLKHAAGFDLMRHTILMALGESPPVPSDDLRCAAAVVLLGSLQAGRLHYNAAGVEWLRRQPWVASLRMDLPPQARVAPFIHGRNRVGEAIVTADNRDLLDERVAEVRRRLDVRAE